MFKKRIYFLDPGSRTAESRHPACRHYLEQLFCSGVPLSNIETDVLLVTALDLHFRRDGASIEPFETADYAGYPLRRGDILCGAGVEIHVMANEVAVRPLSEIPESLRFVQASFPDERIRLRLSPPAKLRRELREMVRIGLYHYPRRVGSRRLVAIVPEEIGLRPGAVEALLHEEWTLEGKIYVLLTRQRPNPVTFFDNRRPSPAAPEVVRYWDPSTLSLRQSNK